MKRIDQVVTLKSSEHVGSHAPTAPLGDILRLIQPAARQAIRMTFEGRSDARGRRPSWLTAAADIRFTGISGTDDTLLHFEVPTLGEAAEDLYRQQELFPILPAPDQTGFDLLENVASEIIAGNRNSDCFDPHLLGCLSRFDGAINGTFSAMVLPESGTSKRAPIIDHAFIERVKKFHRETPPSQPARIVGILDMIRASTRTFALKLPDGQEVRCVLADGDISTIAPLFRTQILVLGRAVFRPSGQLLRIDAEEIMSAGDDQMFFARIPTPRGRSLTRRAALLPKSRHKGIAAIIGQWPGEESDEELRKILEEID
jgi:hypothetical protein